MVKIVIRILVVVVALSAAVWIIRGCCPHLFWKSRSHAYGILAEDVALYGHSRTNIIGVLGKGTVVFPPDNEEYSMTDPGDIQFYKVYVRLSHDTINKLIDYPTHENYTHENYTNKIH